jgi:hypothetical protein
LRELGLSLPIEGNVIRILDEYTVVLNVGQEQGVQLGNRFVVYSEGEDIIDPSSKRILGKYEYQKATVEITRVLERFSEAQSLKREYSSPMDEAISSLRIGIITANKLPVDQSDIKPLAPSPEKKIKIGDKVRRIA